MIGESWSPVSVLEQALDDNNEEEEADKEKEEEGEEVMLVLLLSPIYTQKHSYTRVCIFYNTMRTLIIIKLPFPHCPINWCHREGFSWLSNKDCRVYWHGFFIFLYIVNTSWPASLPTCLRHKSKPGIISSLTDSTVTNFAPDVTNITLVAS